MSKNTKNDTTDNIPISTGINLDVVEKALVTAGNDLIDKTKKTD